MSRCERSLTAKPLHFVAVFLNIKIGVYPTSSRGAAQAVLYVRAQAVCATWRRAKNRCTIHMIKGLEGGLATAADQGYAIISSSTQSSSTWWNVYRRIWLNEVVCRKLTHHCTTNIYRLNFHNSHSWNMMRCSRVSSSRQKT